MTTSRRPRSSVGTDGTGGRCSTRNDVVAAGASAHQAAQLGSTRSTSVQSQARTATAEVDLDVAVAGVEPAEDPDPEPVAPAHPTSPALPARR